MKNKILIGLDSRQSKIVEKVFEMLNQTHIDLAEFACLVSSGECLSFKAFSEIRILQERIEDMCNMMEAPPKSSPFFEIYEELDLADGFLSCLMVTLWPQEKLPTSQLLEWREATVIYAVLFSTMHRVKNALAAFRELTVCIC